MKVIHRILSIFSSPFFVPVYIALMTIWGNHYAFGGNKLGVFMTIQIAIWSLLLPSFGLLLMKQLKLMGPVDDERAKRIIPHFLFLMTYSIGMSTIYKLPIPQLAKAVLVAPILATVLSLFISNFMKVCTHGVGMGVLVGSLIGISLLSVKLTLILSVVILLLAGVVLSSQMILNKYSLREIFYGFFIGFFSQVVAIGIFGFIGVL